MNVRVILVVGAILVAPLSGATACGGGGVTMKDWADQTITVATANDVGSALIGNPGVVGTGLGVLNSMLFTLADFFSEERNVREFSMGVQQIRATDALRAESERLRQDRGFALSQSEISQIRQGALTIQDIREISGLPR